MPIYTCTSCGAKATTAPPCACGKPVTASMAATLAGTGALK